MSNFAVCLFSFDTDSEYSYKQKCKTLIDELIKSDVKSIYLLTDEPNYFKEYSINIVEYKKQNHSYFDKLTICKLALEKFDNVLYIDCDCTLDFSKLKSLKFTNGLSFSEYWLYSSLKKLSDLNQYNDGYFDFILDYCNIHNLNLDSIHLIEERLFTITKENNLEKFFEVYFSLKKLFENNDISFKKYPIGRAEGLAMGIAAFQSNFKITPNEINLISLNLMQVN